MMDTRIALEDKTELEFLNSGRGICKYIIQKELARGASCIVYNASYINNSGDLKAVRIKECYPFKLSIKREKDGSLIPVESDRADFAECLADMKKAFDLGNELFATSGLTNFTSNTVDIYSLNNTVYIVTAYQEGTTLAERNFSSLKDCISVMKNTAKVIAKIHAKGYLYLDLKPENIFSLTGTNEMVQLFDFDSLVPVDICNEKSSEYDYKISYTKGFSALELQTENPKKLGKYSDVYSVGAVLFYLLFGKCPSALDCEFDAVYEYHLSKLAVHSFQDKLYFALTEFFHHTLANYYLDRYPDMQQVIMKLEELENLADITVPYIHSTPIFSPKFLVGRNAELERLAQWICQTNRNCLVVTGMGGIGKSSLVRSYAAVHREEFDTLLYLNYNHSIKQTITDDRQFWINTVEKNEKEDIDDYFTRKINVARKLLSPTKALLIIDNFASDGFAEIRELLDLDWKIILITRSSIMQDKFDYFPVEAIAEKENLYELFEGYLRRKIEPYEYSFLDTIIDKMKGHTLVLELIAKQIANSYLSIQKAAELLEEKGLLELASEKVSYTKDLSVSFDTVKNIIGKIFVSVHMTEEKKTVLKILSFFGVGGIDVHLFAELYGLESKDVINELVAEGWMSIDGQNISMHPVIMETVYGWKQTESFPKTAEQIMNGLRKNLESKQDVKAKNYFLQLSENFLDSCSGEPALKETAEYDKLLLVTVSNVPRHREDYILKHAAELLQKNKNLSGKEILLLTHLIVEIYEERRDFDRGFQVLNWAKDRILPLKNNFLSGKYYEMLIEVYDFLLDGHYDAVTKEDKKILALSLKANNKAIKYMKRASGAEAQDLLGEYFRCKASLFIRNAPQKKKEIIYLLSCVKKILEERKDNTELARNYYLTVAWYDTYVEPDLNHAVQMLKKAYEIELNICHHALDFIDELIVPSANVLLELGESKKSAKILRYGIKWCEENEDIIPYARKKQELYSYLLDVYTISGEEEKYHDVMGVLDEKFQ